MQEPKLKLIYSRETIADTVRAMGKQITKDYQNKAGKIAVIGILRGSCVFFADLIREIKLPIEIDFMAVSSYGTGTNTSGEVRLLKDLDDEIAGKHVIIVEDIMDSGLTLRYLKTVLLSRHPASLKICALLDKPSSRRTPLEADYTGLTVGDQFIVGYGLDMAQRYRNLPEIFEVLE